MKSQQFMRSLASAWSALLLASSVANAATLYVATTGSDANPGTEAQPFRTIAQGVAVAATGDTVQVAAGTYAENVTWANKSLILRGAGPGLSIIDGGQIGACLTISSDANIAGFTIQNGKAPTLYSGGGINHTQGNFTVANCAFTGNTAPTGHGGAINNLAADAGSITSCTFTNNTARDQGGALYNRSHATSVANCTFIENRTAGSGGAIYNSALGPGYPFAPTITGCTFTNNSGGIGGAVANENCAATVNNCIFTGNAATGGNASFPDYGGGGIDNYNATCNVANSSFSGNSATRGGAIFNQSSAAVITNCSITGNTARISGGGLAHQNSSSTTVNCILWGDTGGEVDSDSPSIVAITYSDVMGGYAGTGNISADPQYVDPGGGNFRLQAASPCIDVGTATDLPPGVTLPATDLEGLPRIMGQAPDMGAYELWTPAVGWYVDKATGSDTSGTGSPIAPYATVTKAIASAGAGETIYIKQGNYGTDTPRITKFVHLRNWLNSGWARIGKS
jgi:predicted outer membrane repeat protein